VGKPALNIPGMVGKLSENRTPVSLQFPPEYINQCKARLDLIQKEVNPADRLSFQDAIKIAVAAFFPIEGFEEETALFVNAFLGTPFLPKNDRSKEACQMISLRQAANGDPERKLNFRGELILPNPDVIAGIGRAIERDKQKVLEKSLENPTKQASFKIAKPLVFQEPKKPEKPWEIPLSREISTYFEDHAENRQGYVEVSHDKSHVFISVVEVGARNPTIQHKWNKSDFGYTDEFYRSQAVGFYASYQMLFKHLDKENLIDAVVEALGEQFDENPREDEK
jgi:hypothetical protein